MSEWRPIETAPDMAGQYLVWFAPSCSVRCRIAIYKGGGEWQYNLITHWMPLPTAPDAGRENP